MSTFFEKDLSITIIGLSNAGKSTLVKALMGQTEETAPTIGCESYEFKKGGVKIHAWDMGGGKQFQFMWKIYCQNANAILFVVDSADDEAIKESGDQLRDLFGDDSIPSVPMLICGNKSDLESSKNTEELITGLALTQIEGRDISIFRISAKEMINLDSVVKWLIDHA